LSSALPSAGEPRTDFASTRRDGARLQRICDVSASAALGIAAVVFVGGWLLGIEALRRIPLNAADMKANTAIGIAAGALALLLLRPGASERKHALAMGSAALLAAIGLLSAVQWLFGFDFGIDLLLFADPSSGRSGNLPGRPALGTALAFILLAGAVWRLPRQSRRERQASVATTTLASLLALAGGLAQLVDEGEFHAAMPFGVMAAPTSAALLLLAAALLAANALRDRSAVGPRSPYTGLTLGITLAMGLLATLTWLDWRSGVRMQVASEWVARTHETRAERNRLLADILDVEIGQRSYLLTGLPEFRANMESAIARVALQEERLDGLTFDAEQRRNLTKVVPVIAQRIAAARRTLEILDASGPVAAAREVATLKGQRLTDEIRDALRTMDDRSEALLAARAAAAGREISNERRLIVSGTMLSGVLLIAVFLLLLRETRLRRRSQEELDRFFTLSIDLLGIAGSDGHFRRLNPAFVQTLGHDMASLLARPFLDFVHSDDQEATRAEMAKLDRGEPTLAFENRYRCRDGSWKWISWRVHPFPAEGLLYATARDVTEQKRTSEDLQAANRRLAAANSELEAFSYSVSHDLRAPLRSIDGFSQILLEEYSERLDADGRSHLERVRAAAQRMGCLIDDLIRLSRVGRSQLELTDVDLSGMVAEIVEELRQAEPERQVECAIEPGIVAKGDPQLLQVALQNLLSNAWKFTRGRDPARIGFGATRESGAIEYWVGDNGAGFDMAYGSRLFSPFQRLHSPREFEGTGIGLAIVARIVRRHDGDIRAEAAPDVGAKFLFTLGQEEPSALRTEATS
jgi:PAS domain S-box-containing protein